MIIVEYLTFIFHLLLKACMNHI